MTPCHRRRRPLVVCLLALLLLTLPAAIGPVVAATSGWPAWQSGGGQANIVLISSQASLLQTSDTAW